MIQLKKSIWGAHPPHPQNAGKYPGRTTPLSLRRHGSRTLIFASRIFLSFQTTTFLPSFLEKKGSRFCIGSLKRWERRSFINLAWQEIKGNIFYELILARRAKISIWWRGNWLFCGGWLLENDARFSFTFNVLIVTVLAGAHDDKWEQEVDL